MEEGITQELLITYYINLPSVCVRFPGLWAPNNKHHSDSFFFIFYFILFIYLFLISWRLITLQYCSGFCLTLTWISLGYTCILHPDPPSHLPLWFIFLNFPILSKMSGIVLIILSFLYTELKYISHTHFESTHCQPGTGNHVTEFYPMEHKCL